uniref:Uncharacterized protein n=1 Tax=Caenorhabditis tropicalis TaxID=1561998 RepID=A0A1I7U6U4_9PELO
MQLSYRISIRFSPCFDAAFSHIIFLKSSLRYGRRIPEDLRKEEEELITREPSTSNRREDPSRIPFDDFGNNSKNLEDRHTHTQKQ